MCGKVPQCLKLFHLIHLDFIATKLRKDHNQNNWEQLPSSLHILSISCDQMALNFRCPRSYAHVTLEELIAHSHAWYGRGIFLIQTGFFQNDPTNFLFIHKDTEQASFTESSPLSFLQKILLFEVLLTTYRSWTCSHQPHYFDPFLFCRYSCNFNRTE